MALNNEFPSHHCEYGKLFKFSLKNIISQGRAAEVITFVTFFRGAKRRDDPGKNALIAHLGNLFFVFYENKKDSKIWHFFS